mgnify:CR=1 FL=1
MPILIRKLNYRNIPLEQDTRKEVVGVQLRAGGVKCVPWRGFMDLEHVRTLQQAIPVKLVISAYVPGDEIGCARIELTPGQYGQGCLFDGVVYGVLVDGKPRIVGDIQHCPTVS